MKEEPQLKTVLILFSLVISVTCKKHLEEESIRIDTLEYGPGKRTFLLSKFFLLPTLTAIGMKFLLLLPIFLSKIALLSIMNFIASNLNLLLSAVMGVKNFLASKKTDPPKNVPEEQFVPVKIEDVRDGASYYLDAYVVEPTQEESQYARSNFLRVTHPFVLPETHGYQASDRAQPRNYIKKNKCLRMYDPISQFRKKMYDRAQFNRNYFKI